MLANILKGMPQQLTPKECDKIDDIVRYQKLPAARAFEKINELREKNGEELIGYVSVCKYVKGIHHKRGVPEKRGRKAILKKRDVGKIDTVRKKLVKKKSKKGRRVVWQNLQDDAGYGGECSLRTVQNALRKQKNVRFRRPREKIYISDKDAVKRFDTCTEWLKKPASFWTEKVHGFIDHKSFVMPLTPAQRDKFASTKLVGHLRTPEEGTYEGFTRPRTQHMLLGIPSLLVGAGVVGDKVFCFHVHEKGSWNGAKAAAWYTGPLIQALRRHHPEQGRFLIVEDGDTKGYQSGKGKAAKAEMNIRSMVLPPRSPSLMPLDACLWKAIERKVAATAPERRTETKEQFVARLKRCAKSLPAGTVRKAIARTKECLQGIVDANGWIPKND